MLENEELDPIETAQMESCEPEQIAPDAEAEAEVIEPVICEEIQQEVPAEQMQEPVAEENKDTEKKGNWKKVLLKDLRDILIILSVFMLVYVLFFRAVVVVGDSMNDTLVNGDRLLLVSRTIYRNPKQGDIIVATKDGFRDGEPIIKRIIATEKQWVDIDFETGAVYVGTGDQLELVQWTKLEEPYISSPTKGSETMKFPVQVPEGCVFVMGDNRMNSMDSRSGQIGMIDEREILGKVIFLLFPGSDREHDFQLGRIGVVR